MDCLWSRAFNSHFEVYLGYQTLMDGSIFGGNSVRIAGSAGELKYFKIHFFGNA